MRQRSKLNVKKFGLFLACLGVLGCAGCDYFVVEEFGNDCPRFQYIDMGDIQLRCDDGKGCYRFRCDHNGCGGYGSNEVIYGVDTYEYKKYIDALNYGSCPGDFPICYRSDGSMYELYGSEYDRGPRHCGSVDNIVTIGQCQDLSDCTTNLGMYCLGIKNQSMCVKLQF